MHHHHQIIYLSHIISPIISDLNRVHKITPITVQYSSTAPHSTASKMIMKLNQHHCGTISTQTEYYNHNEGIIYSRDAALYCSKLLSVKAKYINCAHMLFVQ